MVDAQNPSVEATKGGLKVGGQPELNLSQKKPKK